MATTQEMIDEFTASRASYWESRLDAFKNDDLCYKAIVSARDSELTMFKKTLASQRQRDLDHATNLFSDFVQRNGLKGWRFEVEKDGTIKVGRSGIRTTKVEAEAEA